MTLKEYKKKRMKDPAFAEADEELQPEMNVIRAMIDAYKKGDLYHKCN